MEFPASESQAEWKSFFEKIENAIAAEEWDALDAFIENNGLARGVGVFCVPCIITALERKQSPRAHAILDLAKHADHLAAVAATRARAGDAHAQFFTDRKNGVDLFYKTSAALEWISLNLDNGALEEYDRRWGPCSCTKCVAGRTNNKR
jgi:hypothetical protein